MNKAAQKFTYFLFGIAVPVAAGLVWFRTDWFRRGCNRRQTIDRSQQIAVEDSFPASDPPSGW